MQDFFFIAFFTCFVSDSWEPFEPLFTVRRAWESRTNHLILGRKTNSALRNLWALNGFYICVYEYFYCLCSWQWQWNWSPLSVRSLLSRIIFWYQSCVMAVMWYRGSFLWLVSSSRGHILSLSLLYAFNGTILWNLLEVDQALTSTDPATKSSFAHNWFYLSFGEHQINSWSEIVLITINVPAYCSLKRKQ